MADVTDRNTAVIQISGSFDEAIHSVYREGETKNDHSGVVCHEFIRTGGYAGSMYKRTMRIRTGSGVYDVLDTALVVAEKGGAAWGRWTLAAGPFGPEPHDIVAHEYNTMERARDYGLQRSRSNNDTTAVIIAPEQGVDLGDGTPRGFNGTRGIMFAGGKDLYLHNPIFFNVDSTAPGGLQALHRGGSVPERAPAAVAEISDHFQDGIDFTRAQISGDVLKLAPGQSIDLGGARLCVNAGFLEVAALREGQWQTVSRLDLNPPPPMEKIDAGSSRPGRRDPGA